MYSTKRAGKQGKRANALYCKLNYSSNVLLLNFFYFSFP